MAEKTADEVEAEIRAQAEQKQTPEEAARQEFERGPSGDANRAAEQVAFTTSYGADPGTGGPPAEEAASPQVLPTPAAPRPTEKNIMYVMPLPDGVLPAGPAILPHPDKVVVDALGVRLPPLPKDVDPKTVFLTGGKWVNSDGVPIDQVNVKPAEVRLAEQQALIEDLQRQLAQNNNRGANQ